MRGNRVPDSDVDISAGLCICLKTWDTRSESCGIRDLARAVMLICDSRSHLDDCASFTAYNDRSSTLR